MITFKKRTSDWVRVMNSLKIITPALLLLLDMSSTAAAPSAAFLNRSFKQPQDDVLKTRVETTTDEEIDGRDISMDAALEPYLFRSKTQRRDVKINPDSLAAVILDRLGQRVDVEVVKKHSRVNIVVGAEIRRSVFPFYKKGDVWDCHTDYAPSLLNSNRLRESLGGGLSGFGIGGVNAGMVGRQFRLSAGGSWDEFRLVRFEYEQPLTDGNCMTRDWVPHLVIDALDTKISASFADQDLEDVSVGLEWRREDAGYTTWRLGISASGAEGRAGAFPIEDRQRYISVSRFAKNHDRRSQSEVGVRRGLSVLGSTDKDSLGRARPGSDVSFTEVFVAYQQINDLGSLFALETELRGSFSDDDLPAGQGFSVGRDALGGFGNAYDTSEFVGDWGVGMALKFSRPVKGFDAYFMWDIARVGRNNPLAILGEQKTESGASGTLGLDWENRIGWMPIHITLEISKPISREVQEERDKKPRFFFTLCAGVCTYKVGI